MQSHKREAPFPSRSVEILERFFEGPTHRSRGVLVMELFTGMLAPLIAVLAADNSFAQSGWVVQVPEGTGCTLNAVSALDAQTAIAVGDHGTILRTTDGAKWTALPSWTSEHLRGVSFIDAATATA